MARDRINIEDVIEFRRLQKLINEPQIANCDFYKENKKMVIQQVDLDNFRFTGLSNVDFVRSHILGEDFLTQIFITKKSPCSHDYKTDTEYQLMSNPPQYRQECEKCGKINFIFCTDYEKLYVQKKKVTK